LNIIDTSSARIEPALPRGVRINRVIPEEISFQAHPFITKQLPVNIQVDGQLRTYLDSDGPLTIEPQVATITGPSNRIENLQFLPTTPVQLSDIVKPGDILIATPQLPGLDNLITVSPKQFQVIPKVVIKRKNITIQVPIQLTDAMVVGPKTRLSLSTEQVTVTVSWPMNLPDPTPDNFGGLQAFVKLDLESIKTKKSQQVEVEVTAPTEVEIVRYYPARIRVSHETTESDVTANVIPQPWARGSTAAGRQANSSRNSAGRPAAQ
jgi:YbbR domain-containing protein